MTCPLIFEISKPGRKGYSLPECDVPRMDLKEVLPVDMIREKQPDLPEVSEIDLARHYTAYSLMNYGVDTGFYPLGSCTMKYNPKINEDVANLPGFTSVHPYQPEELSQGALQLLYEMEDFLAEISGMDRITFQPAAGAHGELTGMMLVKAYHYKRGDHKRTKVIVPDSAHGTNPATAAMCGFKVMQIKSNERGGVDIEALKAAVNDETAALMLTNPSTLGLFEENIQEIADIVHQAGGLLYYDGANMNAIMGVTRPGDMGFDVIHFNLHKTFSTPHGGGGPGAGPVGVKDFLVPHLPKPLVEYEKEYNRYYFNYDMPDSIGKVKGFYGNFGVIVKAYTYIRALGAEGLRAASENAVLNANYQLAKLKEHFYVPFDRYCMHEFIITPKYLKEYGVHTIDIAKRLLDYGYHPPTVYFPLIVDEAMMIEPTETESKETLDRFVEAMIKIAKEARENPELVKSAPHDTMVTRLDEANAARNPNVRWSCVD